MLPSRIVGERLCSHFVYKWELVNKRRIDCGNNKGLNYGVELHFVSILLSRQVDRLDGSNPVVSHLVSIVIMESFRVINSLFN